MKPIDLVYLWCDMSDEQWNARREEVLSQWSDTFPNGVGAVSRYQAHDELRYSLRSAEQYAPWLHHIFIVVSDDNRLPAWLDTTNPRLTIVRHSEIIPSQYLPTYNSVTIEHFISRIPQLSEHFLYSNDDMFFFDHVTPDFFFDDNGLPIRMVLPYRIDSEDTHYSRTLRNARRLIRKEHPELTEQTRTLLSFFPHHCIDAYCKSHNIATFERYRQYLEPTFTCPFRQDTNIQRALCLMEEVAVHGATTLFVNDTHCSHHFSGKKWQPGLDNSLRLRPKLICINAITENTHDDFEWIRLAMDTLFPKPSSFELSMSQVLSNNE